MKKIFLGFVVVSLIMGCSSTQKLEKKHEKGGVSTQKKIETSNEIMCPMVYEPVCGFSGKTYPNRCVAEEQNEDYVASEGACSDVDKAFRCQEDDQCLMMKKPLLKVLFNEDSQTCIHEDQKEAYREIPSEERRVGGGCACVATLCDAVGSGYFSLNEWDKHIYKNKACEEIDPVCGVDGKTYKNNCEAVNMHRVEIAYAGECEDLKLQVKPIDNDPLEEVLEEVDIYQVTSFEEQQNLPPGVLRMGTFENDIIVQPESLDNDPKEETLEDPQLFSGGKIQESNAEDDFDFKYLKEKSMTEEGMVLDFYFPISCELCAPGIEDCYCPPADEYRVVKNATAIVEAGYELLETNLFCENEFWWIKQNCEKYAYARKVQ